MDPILVIMAAGMGSRYGGLKQVDPVGPGGEVIMDYSLYDAYRAGFRRTIFIIRREHEEVFREAVVGHLPRDMKADFAFQDLRDMPGGEVPYGRTKPWGTAQAVYAARGLVDGPFAVINADDYYGDRAFSLIYDFLAQDPGAGIPTHAMVAYKLNKTLTANGSVSRGVCQVEGGYLARVVEHTRIFQEGEDGRSLVAGEDGKDREILLAGDSPVSMNFWGFRPSFMGAIEDELLSFINKEVPENPLKAECYLPSVITRQLKEGDARVRVLTTDQAWMGVTYQEDKARVREGFTRKVEEGTYPSPLWRE